MAKSAIKTWSQKDIEDLIENNAEESIHLEFKSAGALTKDETRRKEICKDVSAFANSDGGIIIYGISELNHKADSISFIDGNEFPKEWLETVISTGIQRKIDGLTIIPIRFDKKIENTVYVVKIPVSKLAPHMTKENRYYKRYNFASVPMEEYEVRQTYERKDNVKIEIGEVYHKFGAIDDLVITQRIEIETSIHVINVGHIPADIYKLKCVMPVTQGIHISWDRQVKYDITKTKTTNAISSTESAVIFPGEELSVLRFRIEIPLKNLNEFRKMGQIELILYAQTEKFQTSFSLQETVDEFLKKNNLFNGGKNS